MKTKSVLIVALLLAAAVAIPVAAQMTVPVPLKPLVPDPRTGVMDCMSGPSSEAALDKLSLTDDQARKIAKYREMYAAHTVKLAADISDTQVKLNELLSSENPSPFKLASAINRLSMLKAKYARQDVLLAHRIRGVLSDDQIAKFNTNGGSLVYGTGLGESLPGGYLCLFTPG